MQYERALMENGYLSYWGSKIVQPQFIRTAEDYFPDWMNIFTKRMVNEFVRMTFGGR